VKNNSADLEWAVDWKKKLCELIESLDEELPPGAEDN
jgi:hypothetical protein